MAGIEHPFYFVDYLVFVLTIMISLGIGIFYAVSGGKQRTTSEYFVGNRQMTLVPVAISLIVSFESSIMMLGTPAETYVYGFQWMIGNFGYLVSDALSAFIVAPLIHPLKITSAYEYLERRFNSHAVRILGSCLGMLVNVTYMGIVLFGPATAVEAVLGVPLWMSIVLIAIAAVLYTSIGGFKAVIWTDVFQSVIMLTGILAVVIKGTMTAGGVRKTWEIAYEKGRVNIDFDPDPTIRHTFWNLLLGNVIRGLGLGFNQSSVQRIGAMPTVSQAKRILMLTAPGHFVMLSLAAIQGIIAYAYYDTLGCDPLAAKRVQNPNQIRIRVRLIGYSIGTLLSDASQDNTSKCFTFHNALYPERPENIYILPHMVVDIFQNYHGMSGLFMASLFSASLSTMSSNLSSLSALFWTDIIKPHTKPMSELKATLVSKLLVVIFGVIAIFIAYMVSLIGGTLIQITGSMLSAFGGPLTGLFMLGAFCPWANSKGAFIATVVSAIYTFTLAIGQTTIDGTVKNTKLPAGPTDLCYAGVTGNNSMLDTVTHMTSSMTSELMQTSSAYVQEPTGFSRMFMVSYQWFATISIFTVLILGSLISFLTGPLKRGEVDKKYLVPIFDVICPCLPECIRGPLKCGYHDTDVAEQKPEMNGHDHAIAVLRGEERSSVEITPF